MTNQQLVPMHNTSSSSDSLRSKRSIDARKMKLHKERKKTKEHHRAVKRITQSSTLNVNRADISSSAATDENDSIAIPAPPPMPPRSGPRKGRYIDMKLKAKTFGKFRSSSKSKPAASTTAFEASKCTPGKYIQTILQASAPSNKAGTVTSASRMRTAIEDAQKRVFQDEQNENAPLPIHMRSLYQECLSSSSASTTIVKNISNEGGSVTSSSTTSSSCIRTGDDWTSHYRERRLLQRSNKKKMLRRN